MKLRNFLMCLLVMPACLFAENTLQMTSMVVSDLDTAIAQWSAGTGNQFGRVIQETWDVELPNGQQEQIKMRRVVSKRNAPFVELVEVFPVIGPWVPQDGVGSTPGFLVYAADNINQAVAQLKAAGMELVAQSGNDFLICKGVN